MACELGRQPDGVLDSYDSLIAEQSAVPNGETTGTAGDRVGKTKCDLRNGGNVRDLAHVFSRHSKPVPLPIILTVTESAFQFYQG